jgi:hypothetical protein
MAVSGDLSGFLPGQIFDLGFRMDKVAFVLCRGGAVSRLKSGDAAAAT